jgi:hypothetical protein
MLLHQNSEILLDTSFLHSGRNNNILHKFLKEACERPSFMERSTSFWPLNGAPTEGLGETEG